MYSPTTAPESSAPSRLQRAAPPQTPATEVARRASQAVGSGTTTGYDAILLLAALEEIRARQEALAWLVDANLLRLCLA